MLGAWLLVLVSWSTGCGSDTGQAAPTAAADDPGDQATGAGEAAAGTGASTGASPTPTTTVATTADSPMADPDGPHDGASPLGDPYLGPLRFDWPSGCSVPVTEIVGKNGSRATLAYDVDLQTHEQGLLVRYVDLVVNDLDGRPLGAELQAQAQAAFTLPGFIVDADGLALAMTGFDEMLRSLEELGLASPAIYTPEFRAVTEEAVINKYWETLVGLWAGLGRIDQPILRSTLPVPVGDELFDLDLVVESIGTTAEGHAILRSTQRLEGDELLRSMGALQSSLGGGGGSSSGIDGGQRTVTIDLTTDPETLRPVTAELSIDVELVIDGRPESRLERRQWTFDWDAGDCAG